MKLYFDALFVAAKITLNEDKSYIKCTFCNREYLGGIDELRELNQEVLDERMEDIRNDVATHIKDALSKAFSGNKNIKLK